MRNAIALIALLALVPLVQGGEAVALEIVLDSGTVTVEDPQLIDRFEALVGAATPGKDHKCRNVGEMRFRSPDGSTRRFGLLPAHEEGIYGLRVYDRQGGYAVIHVDRRQLLNLLDEAGASG